MHYPDSKTSANSDPQRPFSQKNLVSVQYCRNIYLEIVFYVNKPHLKILDSLIPGLAAKGQLISKCHLSVFNSQKKK